MADHFNPCRNFAYEDEGGLLVATYPEGTRQPTVAAPYAEEVWTGVEYASASHMIMHGLVDEGLAIVGAVRDRYDGARRNPFSEIECGSYYARSMSAWQLVNAWAGLHADRVEGTLRFSPVDTGDFRLLWSAGTGWGELVREGARLDPAGPRRQCGILAGSSWTTGNTVDARLPPGRRWNSADGGNRTQGSPQELPEPGGHPRGRPHHRGRPIHGLRRAFGMRQVDPAAG